LKRISKYNGNSFKNIDLGVDLGGNFGLKKRLFLKSQLADFIP